MTRDMMHDLAAFLAVAREGSFTRAAAGLGVSPSALSHTIRRFEEQLGTRLLARTSRHVSVTERGQQLLERAESPYTQIQQAFTDLVASQDRPSGTLRITTGDHQGERFLLPAVARLLAQYADLTIEVSVSSTLVDLVAERFDAGLRLGETVAQDMIAVPVSPPMEMAVVGAPGYFEAQGTPETPHALLQHRCINLRFPTYGHLYAWEFEKDGRAFTIRVPGPLIVNDIALARQGACSGVGLACLPEDYVRDDLEAGRLGRVLKAWCPPFPGYYLYYPSRRHKTPALTALIEALRYVA